jgi:hypothetical protein
MALPVICLNLVMRSQYHLYDETLSPHKNCPVCHPKSGILAKSNKSPGRETREASAASQMKGIIRKKRKILVRSNEISRGKKLKKSFNASTLAPPIKM